MVLLASGRTELMNVHRKAAFEVFLSQVEPVLESFDHPVCLLDKVLLLLLLVDFLCGLALVL